MKAIISQISLISPWLLLVGILLTILASALNAWKWKILLKGQGVVISYLLALKLFLIGFFFNHFMLTGVGDVKRIWDLGKARNQMTQVLISVLLERWSGMLMLFFWVVLGLNFAKRNFPQIKPFLWASLLIFVLVLFLPVLIPRLRKTRLGTWIEKKLGAVPDFSGFYRRKDILAAIVLSFPAPFLVVLIYWIIGCGLNLQVGFVNYIYFAPLILAASFLPVSASGLGVQEAAFLLLFSQLKVPGQTILSLSLLAQATKLGAATIGGLLYLRADSYTRATRLGKK